MLQKNPEFAQRSAATRRRPGLNFWSAVVLLLLLSLLLVLLGGYRFGVGNQTIQIPFLKHQIDSKLFANDSMVRQTLGDYPTYFFRVLAWLLPGGGNIDHQIYIAYFLLHLATSAAVMGAVMLLCRAMFGSWSAGWVMILLLLAGNHGALGGDDLYSTGFTHTWAIFPLAIVTLALLYRGHLAAAFLLAGVLFNLHALTAAYLAVMCLACALGELRPAGWKSAALRSGLLLLLFTLAAMPTLLLMRSAGGGAFDQDWIRITHLRSAAHSFPSQWWQAGNPDVPRFALIVALAALAMSFPTRSRTVRITVLLSIGAGLLMLIGFVFADVYPLPIVLRAQLWRSSRLLLVLAFAYIAFGLMRAWQLPRRELPAIKKISAWLEIGSATFTALCLAIPPFLPMLPVALVVALIAALISARLFWMQAVIAAAAICTCVLANEQIGFPLLAGIGPGAAAGVALATNCWMIALCAAALLAIGATQLWPKRGLRLSLRPAASSPAAGASAVRSAIRIATLAAGVGVYIAVAITLFHASQTADARDPWLQAQQWARNHTDLGAVFLTPPEPGGFRVESDRAIVGEWRDGTQAYFSPLFGKSWQQTMQSLEPQAMYDRAGIHLLSRGKSLDELPDQALIDLCRQWKADYLVLPRSAAGARDADADHHLKLAFADDRWAIYEPVLLPHVTGGGSTTSARPLSPIKIQQERFMHDVVLPNIEKYRKSDVRLQIVDSAGRPMVDAPYEIQQTKQAFNFGCSMEYFTDPAPTGPSFDFHPPPTTPIEKELLPKIFNFSLIAFSAKWACLEPQEGHYYYDDLDRYVDFCTSHGLGMEFHFVSGYAPLWLAHKSVAEQNALFLAHAKMLVQRYGSRIKYWQVVNERHLIGGSPPVFAAMHQLDPEIHLGISDCAQFYDPRNPRQRENPLFRGLNDVKWLKSQGAPIDFFSFHGHRPFGVWPEAKEMYEALDGFANAGVKIHISEFSCPLGHQILGRLKQGTWTPQLQAEFYRYIYTVCFSHPDVEMINLWGMGPNTWQNDSGLLDAKSQPKPAYYAMQDLLQNQWHTHLSGTLPLDGIISFRGFHGDYRVTVTLPDGRKAAGTFPVAPGSLVNVRLNLNATPALAE